jgi:hypothetical protein
MEQHFAHQLADVGKEQFSHQLPNLMKQKIA